MTSHKLVMRFGAAALLLPLCSLLLTGCWDRTELNDMAFALSTAIDKEPDGSYRVAYMLPLPGQMGGGSGGGGGTGGKESYYIDSETGATIREAADKLQKRLSRQLFVSHSRTVLIGEELAKEGISELFDTIPRLPESRLSAFMVVTKGPAWKLLGAKPKLERFPAESVRELAKAPGAMKENAKDVAVALSLNSDPVIIYMGRKQSEKGDEPSQEIEVLGYAQMKGDKLVGIFNTEMTRGLMWLRTAVKPYNVTLLDPQSRKSLVVLVSHGTTHITTELEGSSVTVHIELEASAKVRENYSDLDMNETADIHKVESLLSNQIKTNVKQTIAQMQSRGTDSAHIGNYVWRKFPAAWYDRIEPQWHQVFKNAKFDVQVKTSITDVGLINRNATKRSY
jgi:spore germination protein KC/spore germination protein